jgi:hypothetical protein
VPRRKQGRAIPKFDRLLQVRSDIEYECSFWGRNIARRLCYMKRIPLISLQAVISVNRARSFLVGCPDLPGPMPVSAVLCDQRMVHERQARSEMVRANLSLPTECVIHSTGHLRIHTANAQLGPSPMPQALPEGRATVIDEVLDGSIGTAAFGFLLDSVNVSDGILAVTERVR